MVEYELVSLSRAFGGVISPKKNRTNIFKPSFQEINLMKQFRAVRIRKARIVKVNNSSKDNPDQNPREKLNVFSKNFKKQNFGGKMLGAVLDTTTAPVGSYNSELQTYLHNIDPRVKQVHPHLDT